MSGRNYYYSEKEKQYVFRNFNKKTKHEIAFYLNRSYNSVKSFMYLNGLKSVEMEKKRRSQLVGTIRFKKRCTIERELMLIEKENQKFRLSFPDVYKRIEHQKEVASDELKALNQFNYSGLMYESYLSRINLLSKIINT